MEKIFILIPWFTPAYKAGGPVQSIDNLVGRLPGKYAYQIFTSASDLDGKTLKTIKFDVWIYYNKNTQVYYCSQGNKKIAVLQRELKSSGAGIVFINGIFDSYFSIVPIFFLKGGKKIISARGMLQPGALKTKSFKKKLFLWVLKMSSVLKQITWHATNVEEERDIKKIFGQQAKVIIAQNIPKRPVEQLVEPSKEKDTLRLVYLSLIAEKKNLLGLLELVLKCGQGVSLDIYGPPKDQAYWESCKKIIEANPEQLQYKGDVVPQQVQETFMHYDASIFLTRGENFGHALYESMSAGRPIITSYFTPWNKLEEKKAGWNVDIADKGACLNKLKAICGMDAASFNAFSRGAYDVAVGYYNTIDLSEYERLFDIG